MLIAALLTLSAFFVITDVFGQQDKSVKEVIEEVKIAFQDGYRQGSIDISVTIAEYIKESCGNPPYKLKVKVYVNGEQKVITYDCFDPLARI